MGERIAFFGNCQAGALARVYRTFIAPFYEQDVMHVNAQSENVRQRMQELRSADIVVVQQFDFPSKVQVGDLRPGVRHHTFPMVVAGFLWPYGSQAHPQNSALPFHPAGPYPTQLGDGFLNRMISKGVPHDEAARQYLELDIGRKANLDRLFELYMIRQRERDARTGVAIADLIEENFRDEPLFLTPDHPELRVFKALASQVYLRLGVPEGTVERALGALLHTPFPPGALPIHPGVARHFGLRFATEDRKYTFHREGGITFAEYVRRYLRYEWNAELHEGIHIRSKDPHRALQLLEVGLGKSPWSHDGLLAKSGVLLRLGRVDEALEPARRATELNPTAPEGFIALSRVLRTKQDLAGAERAARHAIELFPSFAPSHLALAEVLSSAGRTGEGVEAARHAIALRPGDAQAHATLGRLLLRQDDLPGAEAALRRATRLNPRAAGFHIVLADILRRQGRKDEAIATLQDMPDGQDQTPQLHAHLGNLLLGKGDLDGAEQAFRRAVELGPNLDGPRNGLARVLKRKSQRIAPARLPRASRALSRAGGRG